MNPQTWVDTLDPCRLVLILVTGTVFVLIMMLSRHKRHRMRREGNIVRWQRAFVRASVLAAVGGLLAWLIFALALVAFGPESP
jgi:multisubunit Na+/H+ antiporter MnhB subunit